ncbi:arabinogalactan endo-beta-1,4-galactanase [Actinoplanes sp. OR16]|uniref:glycoside hydrolase family 53 protein n=1 Tax=Actinoplanes sp. OR16 TaxID=946334 RepID=UPI000F6C536B|nr:glycosyl hydrolase 53 family protein [Actinoplanes sp. OR16]BBH68132.1 arabinogalactan endo-beta-1,4-galactanase [Actinoplanes sp. OR16]
MRALKALFMAAVLAATVALTGTPAQAASLTMLGADVSSLQRSLDLGAKYYKNGAATDPYDILKGAGANYMRLRVWNNPASGYNNKAKVLQQARSIKAKGLKLLIDFHYSDTWADPGKQYPPAAWASHSLSQLQTDVYNYTYDVCTALKAQGTTPDSVQIGNEINVGMLWPVGQVSNSNFAPLASLLKQGYNATKACNSSTQVMIHTANSDSLTNARWFYDGIKAAGVTWDITALSYYCMWHGTLANLYNVITDLRTRYAKPVVIAETAYQFTSADADAEKNSIPGTVLCDNIPSTWAGQAQQFTWVQNTARNAGAIGVFYWEPTWTAIAGNGWDPANINGTGDGWDNMATFDWSGNVNPSIKWTA